MVAFRGVFSNVFKNGRILFRADTVRLNGERVLRRAFVNYEYFNRKLKYYKREKIPPSPPPFPGQWSAACRRAIIEGNQLAAMPTQIVGERAVSTTGARRKWLATRALLICRVFRNIFLK